MGVENRRAASGTGSGGGTNPFNFKRPSREGESHSRKGGEVELNVISSAKFVGAPGFGSWRDSDEEGLEGVSRHMRTCHLNSLRSLVVQCRVVPNYCLFPFYHRAMSGITGTVLPA